MGDAVRNEKPQVDPGRLTGDTGDAGELQAEPSAATGVASPNTFVALTESTLVTPQSSNAGISERFHRAALTHDWQQTLKRGVEAESQYLLATNSGVDDGLRLRWIIQVCDALQSYEPCAADLNRVYLWQSQAVRAALADESLREIHTQIREVSAALQHDLKWLKELLDLAVRYRFTPMLSSLVEARQRNRWPHELDSFDWPQFRRELLAVRDEVHHRLTEATGDGGTNETPAAPSRGAKPGDETSESANLTTNERMVVEFTRDPSCINRTAEVWGQLLGVDPSTIRKTATWINVIQSERERSRNELRNRPGSRGRKVVRKRI